MKALALIVCLGLVGCGQSATEKLAEQELAKRASRLEICESLVKANNMEGLADFKNSHEEEMRTDAAFRPYLLKAMDWENDQFKASMGMSVNQ